MTHHFFRIIFAATLAASASLGGVPPTFAQAPAGPQTPAVQVDFVQGNVFLITGAGGNITASAGEDGLLLVDSGSGPASAQVIAAIARLPAFLDQTGSPKAGPPAISNLRYLLNTSALGEHTGGNATLAAAAAGVSVYAHENVLSRMVEAKVPARAEPTLTFFGGRMAISRWFNGEPIEIVHMPAAITDGDTVVRFFRSGVVSAGAIFDYTQFPQIDVAKGGSVNGLIDALNRLLTMVIPNSNAQGGTYVIGAHGRICDNAELANYRNMVTIVRDRVKSLIDKGMTLAQVQATRPTEDYNTRFGRNPNWTPAMFVEAVYTSLKSGSATSSARE